VTSNKPAKRDSSDLPASKSRTFRNVSIGFCVRMNQSCVSGSEKKERTEASNNRFHEESLLWVNCTMLSKFLISFLFHSPSSFCLIFVNIYIENVVAKGFRRGAVHNRSIRKVR
jgi:hypothetical protein